MYTLISESHPLILTLKQGDEFDRLFGEAVDQLMKFGRLIQNFDSACVSIILGVLRASHR